MRKQTVALFDVLLTEINRDLEIYSQASAEDFSSGAESDEVLSDSMAHPDVDRTSCLSNTNIGRLRAIRNLVPGLRKRFIGESISNTTSAVLRAQRCIDLFIESNERCKVFNLQYDRFALPAFVQLVRGEVILDLERTLELSNRPLTLSEVAARMCSGPGSSSGVTTDPGSFSRMAEGPMSFSSPYVQRLYRTCTFLHPTVCAAEAVRKSIYGKDDNVNACASFTTVPKSYEIDRGICSQPSGNMVLQLAVHSYLAQVLRESYGCDLVTQQSRNRELARYGSLGTYHSTERTWRFCTVDLSEASNFPWVLIQDHFPGVISEFLFTIRSPKMAMPNGDIIEKEMCSTMGNGFTFSLMTLFLSSIVKVLYSLAGLPPTCTDPRTGKSVQSWAVYGDDIIVDRSVLDALYKVLDAYGFRVNRAKSFNGGLLGGFRESCGADFYFGYPVRPVFCERLQTQTDIYSLYNRLAYWGAFHSVPLPNALRALRTYVVENYGREHRVPNWEDVSSGIHVPRGLNYVEPPVKGLPFSGNGSYVYKALRPVPDSRLCFSEKLVTVKYSCIATKEEYSYLACINTEWYVRNQIGVFLFTLSGDVRMGRYGVRSHTTRYKETSLFAPGWGDPSLFGGTATSLRAGTTTAAYRLWENYIRRHW